MNGYADSGLPRMRTAFARIVPVSSDADTRPEDRGRATLQEKYDKKVLGSFSSTERERGRKKKGVTRTASNISCSLLSAIVLAVLASSELGQIQKHPACPAWGMSSLTQPK